MDPLKVHPVEEEAGHLVYLKMLKDQMVEVEVGLLKVLKLPKIQLEVQLEVVEILQKVLK